MERSMKMQDLLLAAAAWMGFSTAVGAVTLIEERDSESTTLMYLEDGKMRVETAGEPGYMLADLRRRKFFAVDPAKKRAADMSAQMLPQQARAQSPKVAGILEKVGSGPRIAGYATEHYVLTANGQKCEEIFTSKQAFIDSGMGSLWSDFAAAFKGLSASAEGASPCDVAENQADPSKFGLPLRTVSSDGQTTEVIRIEKGVAAPPGGFEVPRGYRTVTMQELFSDALDDDRASRRE